MEKMRNFYSTHRQGRTYGILPPTPTPTKATSTRRAVYEGEAPEEIPKMPEIRHVRLKDHLLPITSTKMPQVKAPTAKPTLKATDNCPMLYSAHKSQDVWVNESKSFHCLYYSLSALNPGSFIRGTEIRPKACAQSKSMKNPAPQRKKTHHWYRPMPIRSSS